MTDKNKRIHRGGLWADPDVSRSYFELKDTLLAIEAETTTSLMIKGNGAIGQAKAAEIVAKAKIFENFVKAASLGRK